MDIRFTCPNGHPLKAKRSAAGHSSCCPKCSAPVRVPDAKPLQVTDSGAMAILGDYEPSARRESKASILRPKRKCPRCAAVIAAAERICTHCGVYLMASPGDLGAA